METTTKYGLFKTMTGNRDVERAHVRRLKDAMVANPRLLEISPILVNENMFVIDGQHRLQAAKELKLPVTYTKRNDVTIEDTRAMNLVQKQWHLMDFAKSYAQQGDKNYQDFIGYVARYPRLTPGIILAILLNNEKSAVRQMFRNGEFEITNPDAGLYLERLNWLQTRIPGKINIPTASAFMELFSNPEVFDWEKFTAKFTQHSGAAKLFEVGISRRNALRSIEDVYNFMSNIRERLY